MKNSLLIIVTLFCLTLQAQPDSILSRRITTQSYQIGLGGVSILDTYLTPERFTGTSLIGLSTIERQRIGSDCSTLMQHQLQMAQASDRAKHEAMLEATYNFFWGRYHGWHLMDGDLLLQGGATANATLGALYHTRSNANNPAQARLSLLLMPSAIATWRVPNLHGRLTVRYEIDIPLVGLMFSPNYGQSYYEMFALGDYDHNAVPVTTFSAPTFRQQLTVRYTLSSLTTLSLGYLGDYSQAQVNHLKQHVRSHHFMVGIVRRFQLINHRL